MAAAPNHLNNNNNNRDSMETNTAAALNNNYSDSMNELFVRRHGFAEPLANPKILVDTSFLQAVIEFGKTPAQSVKSLVGPARFFATRCMCRDMSRSGCDDALLTDINLERCLHDGSMNHKECMGLLLASVNPRGYILATLANTHLADTVNGLPMISVDEQGEAKFRDPSQRQVHYASTTRPSVIRRLSKAEKTYMTNRINKMKRRD